MNPVAFVELSKILAITFIVTGIIRFLKQPAIIGYIVSGIIAGPLVLNIIHSTDTLNAFSQIGIALLLFIVGLNLNPKVIKDVGKIALITGIGQVLFTGIIGFAIATMLGFSAVVSAYLGIALAFSSTIIIMKLLSDKRELESLHGTISIGFLIVQDFIAILLLLVISSFSNGADLTSLAFGTTLKGLGGIICLFLLTIYVLPFITKIVAKSQEYLLLFSVSWCFAVAAVFYYLNFSLEAGALLAGITLSMSPFHHEISSKLKPIRDFFLVLFFILLGSQMVISNVVQNIGIILLLSAFVLIGNPIIVMLLMGKSGYTKRTSFMSGLTVAQISEFSLILIALGVTSGHLTQKISSIVTAVGLITFAGSSYLIMYSNKIYSALSSYLSVFEIKGKKVDERKRHRSIKHDVILFGYNRIGLDILDSVKKIGKKLLVIDYNPEVVNSLSKRGLDCVYGDANDAELLDELNLAKAKMIVSTIPVLETNLLIISKVKSENKKAIVAVVSHQISDAEILYDAGASYVIMPHFLGGKHFSKMVERHKLNKKNFAKEKQHHLKHIKKRKKLGHDHPNHTK